MDASTVIRATRWLLVALLLACGGASDAGPGENSVKPGINDRFLDPDLDVDRWTKTFEGESREISASRKQILAALELKPGHEIADVGAGTGLFLAPFSEAVGEKGHVFAVDISPKFLEHLRKRANKEKLDNVTVVTGGERSVELAKGSVDVVFVCDTYHHFEYPKATLASILEALRPGGALVVVDFERVPGVTKKWVLNHVRAGKKVFRAEIEKAGFAFDRELKIDGLKENYAIRFTAPTGAE
jgi:SAM-dependent methyltransferase